MAFIIGAAMLIDTEAPGLSYLVVGHRWRGGVQRRPSCLLLGYAWRRQRLPPAAARGLLGRRPRCSTGRTGAAMSGRRASAGRAGASGLRGGAPVAPAGIDGSDADRAGHGRADRGRRR